MFKRPIKDWKNSAGFFFEIYPHWYRYGMGFYTASRQTMDKFREKVADNPTEFKRIINPFWSKKRFNLEGDKYKRPPLLHDDPDIMEWFYFKTFYICRNCELDEILFNHQLVDTLIKDFETLIPLYKYLWDLLDNPIPDDSP